MPEKETIRLAGVVRESIVDGPGFRFTIFCQGCPHDCPGCHNPDTHDFEGGYDCRFDTLVDAIDKDKLLDGVTFRSDEPFCQTATPPYSSTTRAIWLPAARSSTSSEASGMVSGTRGTGVMREEEATDTAPRRS